MDFTLMKNKNFRLYLFGNISSVFGDIMLDIALALYVLNITNSATKFASIIAIEIIPKLFLGFFSGALVDRVDKKKVVVFLDFFRGIFLIILFIVFLSGNFNVPAIYFTVIVFSICDVFFGPSFISLLPGILKGDELVQGNAINETCMQVFSIVAPMVATLIFGTFGIGAILLLDGVTFIISAIVEYAMKINLKRVDNTEKVNIISEVVDGFKVSFKDVQMISLVINGLVTHLVLFPFVILGIPFLINNVVKAPEFYYGIVSSFATIGALIATLIIAITNKKLAIFRGINYGIFAMVISSFMFIPLGFPGVIEFFIGSKVSCLVYMSIINLAMNLSFGFYGVFFVSAYQSKIPTDYLGRFGAMFVTITSLGRFIGLEVMGRIFDLNNFMLAVAILIGGMMIKILIHIPYMRSSSNGRMAKE